MRLDDRSYLMTLSDMTRENRIETSAARESSPSADVLDLLIVGAGPAGLQAGCTAQDLGLSCAVLDRYGLAHSFAAYPQTLRFFSPADEMTVGGVPFPMRGGDRPTREDILPYFRAVAAFRKLNLRLWERITDIRSENGLFVIETSQMPNDVTRGLLRCRNLVLAGGVWDVPTRLPCPGSDLPHVHSRFHEPTEYFGMECMVVGGGNSALTAALMLAEAHAKVVLAMRRPPVPYQSHLRPFVIRDLEFAVEEGKLTLHSGVIVSRIEPGQAWLQPADYLPDHPQGGVPAGSPFPVPARFVFALLGHRGDATLYTRLGLCLDPDGRPQTNPETFETNVPGIYVAGSLAGQKIDIILRGREQAASVVRRVADAVRTRGT